MSPSLPPVLLSLYPPIWNPPFRNTQVRLFFPPSLCLLPPPAWFRSWVASSPENVMSRTCHVMPAAAGYQISSHLMKGPSRNLVDSILNSWESPLSKMLSNSPPSHSKPCMSPSPNHFHQHVPPFQLRWSKYFAILSKFPAQNLVDSILKRQKASASCKHACN